MLVFNFYLYLQQYGLWNEDDSKNHESLVLEENNERKMDNTKLLLGVITRSVLGYDYFKPQKPMVECGIKKFIY